MSESTELWNTTEVARYLGVKAGTVSAYRHRGQMPPPVRTIGGRTHLWDANIIRAWRSGTEATPLPTASNTTTKPGEWITHGERNLYVNEWVTLSLVDIETPSGERLNHHVVTMKPAVIIVVVNDQKDAVGMVWRHRFAPNTWGWELPGGLIEPGEDPICTAQRELMEEQGLSRGTLKHLVTFEPAVGMVRNPHHVYVAQGYEKTQEPTELDEGGQIQWLRLDSLRERIDSGGINNSGSLIAILYLLAFNDVL